MTHYTIEASPDLNVHARAFGARVSQERVLVPQRLATLLTPYALGNDALTVAGFLKSFPASVASPLGLSQDEAHHSAEELVDLLQESGADVSILKKKIEEPPLGALHPSLLKVP